MAERRVGLPVAEREACARAVAARLLALPALTPRRARRASLPRVSAYVAVRGELDPAPAEDALAAGFTVALPRIETRSPPRLRFHVVAAAGDLCEGPHGLTEPLPSCAEIAVEDIDVMLVPGLAFDAAGRRLGQGGGYYDGSARQLRARRGSARRPAGLLIGLAYDFQIVESCPSDERDVAVDLIVTESRVLDARAAT